ncbi:hypothetical protein FRB95_014685 [Tulasnella sp. JGI-2019a]|nr:hypothetical protein FRB95_014685 [Tulasnella sp. JGI-2019a]
MGASGLPCFVPVCLAPVSTVLPSPNPLAFHVVSMGADTLQASKASLQALSVILKAVPIPEPFKSAVVGIPDAVLQIITIVETAKGNMEDAQVLAVYIATITDKTIRPLDLSNVTPATLNRIYEFQKPSCRLRKRSQNWLPGGR